MSRTPDIGGAYVVWVYCGRKGCSLSRQLGPIEGVQFSGRTKAKATQAARRSGWAVTHPCGRYPAGRVRCPECKVSAPA